MELGSGEARARFGAGAVARLGTADARGVPHVVPVTFAVSGDMVFFAVDHKPKRTWDLRRLRNVRENPRVSVLVDHYADDWSELWWARADGRAEVWEAGAGRGAAVELLRGKYEQYRDRPPEGPVVAIQVERWSGWAFTG
ncbi:TIGR03668 family PPOX class F420-dependent oxidoreductase [Streptomyces sp. GMY02]|uniref:TIGR03668 family PPOX class F420-dependent oxidoreductase n=1 Tax=Streptomyces sp. GMY02 TaxID=1333528 RepID=UPI001C2CA7E5|nr:TIGR03668 family PPOX class F420-dependent oxidoreductase [Streptomyces sp. GMY02]QXE35952.1 TIGR03668 family PPOX class F420-dependent oxidoreductase [Streptomyces sp. GMY02]